MKLKKQHLLHLCEKLNLDKVGTNQQLIKRINNYFGANYFYTAGGGQIYIKNDHMNKIDKNLFSSQKKLNTNLKCCPNCKKEVPANKFRSLSGSVREHCLECRKLLGEK